jgi:hypothetical protein
MRELVLVHVSARDVPVQAKDHSRMGLAKPQAHTRKETYGNNNKNKVFDSDQL